MSKISEIMSVRRDTETITTMPFIEYTMKYMDKIQDKSAESAARESKKNLQKILRNIGEWESSKIDREYDKFCKWCSKKGISVNNIEEQFNLFIVLSLQIMLNKRLHGIVKDKVDNDNLNIKELFYKCMRRVARKLYDCVKGGGTVEECYVNKKETTNIVVSCLHEFIPLEKLIEIMELLEEDEESNHSYDFDRTFSDLQSVENSEGKLIVEKEGTTDSGLDDNKFTVRDNCEGRLHYVPSEDIEDEYFHSDIEQKAQSNDDNIKEIKIPKYNNKGLYKNKRKEPIRKPKINEKDENFFTE